LARDAHPSLRRFTQVELNEAIARHDLWLQGRPEGRYVDLAYTDLSSLCLNGRHWHTPTLFAPVSWHAY
jgi:hypothetical protein